MGEVLQWHDEVIDRVKRMRVAEYRRLHKTPVLGPLKPQIPHGVELPEQSDVLVTSKDILRSIQVRDDALEGRIYLADEKK